MPYQGSRRCPPNSAPRADPGDLPREPSRNRKGAPHSPASEARQCAIIRPHHPVGVPCNRHGWPRLYNTSAGGDDTVLAGLM